MNKGIKDLEKKLKESTGEDNLPNESLAKIKGKKSFDAAKFIRLAKEIKKIIVEDERNSNIAINS